MPHLGVISDTHGLVRPEALEALAGSELILHAGDIGGPEVIEALERLAPVVAVRGNNDRGAWAGGIPETTVVEACGLRVHVLHDLADLSIDAAAEGIDAVVCGHSHRPEFRELKGVPVLNPGSAGPRRFTLPVTVARLWRADGRVESERIDLLEGQVEGGARRR